MRQTREPARSKERGTGSRHARFSSPSSSPEYVKPEELRPGEFECFRAGVHPKYPDIQFTTEQLDAWVEKAHAKGMPLIFLGDHADDNAAPIDDGIVNLRRVRGSLVAQHSEDLPQFFADQVRAGWWPDVSVQLEPDDAGLEHVAFLWGYEPAVKGMLPTQTRFAGLSGRTPSVPEKTAHCFTARRPALRFDDYGTEVQAVSIVDAPLSIDVAGELAAEDVQSKVSRVMWKVQELVDRVLYAVGLKPEEKISALEDIAQQAGQVLPEAATGAASFRSTTNAGDDEMLSKEQMEELKNSFAAGVKEQVEALVKPLAEQVKSFGETLTKSQTEQAASRDAQMRERATAFAHRMLNEGRLVPASDLPLVVAQHVAAQKADPIKFSDANGKEVELSAVDTFERDWAKKAPVVSMKREIETPTTGPLAGNNSFGDQAAAVEEKTRELVREARKNGEPLTFAEATVRAAKALGVYRKPAIGE